jgi:hypothetical protein
MFGMAAGQLRVFGVTHRWVHHTIQQGFDASQRHFVAWQSKVAVELGERLQEAAGFR